MKFISVKKILLFLAVFAVAVFALSYLVIFPLIKEIKEASDEFVSIKGNISALEAKIKNSAILKELYLKNQQNFTEIDSLFIDSKIPINFVNFLKEAAESSRLSINISSPFFQEGEDGTQNFLSFHISLIGSSLDITKSLAKVEYAPYPVEIQKLKLQRSAENNTESNFSIKVFSK